MLREIAFLTRDTVALWLRFFPLLAGWFALGYGIRAATMQIAIIVGTERVVLGNLIFVLGLVAWILSLVLMIASTGPGLRFDRDAPLDGELGRVYSEHTRREVLLHGAAPFVALYAVGGFAEEQVDQLQRAALSVLNMDYHEYQLVRFDQWPVFLAMAAVAWVVQQAAALIHRQWPTLVTGLVQIAAKSTVVLSVFIVVTELAGRFLSWLSTRAFVGWIAEGWAAFADLLPAWQIFHLTLPEIVRDAGSYLVGTVLPGAVTVILIPLAWLALTAAVFGWREMGRNLIGTTAGEAAVLERAGRLRSSRAGRGLADAAADGPLRVAVDLMRHVGSDYLPVLQGVRLIARAGARFVAAYLVVYAVVELVQRYAGEGLWRVAGRLPGDQDVFNTVFMFLVGMVFTTLLVALYAQGFDRAILAATRGPGQESDTATALAGNPGTSTTR